MSEKAKRIYTRPILKETPAHPISNGKAQFGNFEGRFEYFAIKGLRRPFGNLPVPTRLTDLSVNTFMRFLFHGPKIIGEISFFVSPIFSTMETVYWDKTTKKKNAYRQFLPSGFLHMPKWLGYNITACRTSQRYVRLLSRLTRGSMHADVDFVGSKGRPALEARFDVNVQHPEAVQMSAVIPYFVTKRCEASYCFTAPMSGWLSENYRRDFAFPIEDSVCFFDYRKAYCGRQTKRILLTAFGTQEGKLISFQLSSPVAPDPDTYNDNILFYAGERTPLPPVKITMPFGIEQKWIIQDTEGMIDVTFIPISLLSRNFIRSDYNTVYGTFNGTLLRKNGEAVKLDAYGGIAKKFNLKF